MNTHEADAHARTDRPFEHTWTPPDRRKRKIAGGFSSWAITAPLWILAFLRTVCPILRLGRFLAIVSRHEDVAEVLSQDDVFRVPWPQRVRILNDGDLPGTPFILGMNDRTEHAAMLKQVMRAFDRSDIAALVVPQLVRSAEEIVAQAPGGKLEAIRGLVTRVALELCVSYHGVPIPEGKREEFADWTIAMSGDLFGWPPFDDRPKPAAVAGAERLRRTVDAAIKAETTRQRGGQKYDTGTVLSRLVSMHLNDPRALTARQIRSFLTGMIIGFVPTNTMAAGHILEVLLNKREALAYAQRAAEAGDDDLLKRYLFEALRFMPINPGPFRICARDYTVAADTRRATTIKTGTRVWALTMSAMLDSRRIPDPSRFDPRRPASNYMHFGYGMHWCAGVFIAEAHITQTFKALLRRPKLTLTRAQGKDGQLQLLGGFPDQLWVKFEPVKP